MPYQRVPLGLQGTCFRHVLKLTTCLAPLLCGTGSWLPGRPGTEHPDTDMCCAVIRLPWQRRRVLIIGSGQIIAA